MTKSKSRSGGRRPRAKGGSSAGKQERHASESRKRLKGRIQALEARYATLHSWVGELHEALTGESVRVHPDDMAGNQPFEMDDRGLSEEE